MPMLRLSKAVLHTFSVDGRKFASRSGSPNLEDNLLTKPLMGPRSCYRVIHTLYLTFTPDGKLIAAGSIGCRGGQYDL